MQYEPEMTDATARLERRLGEEARRFATRMAGLPAAIAPGLTPDALKPGGTAGEGTAGRETPRQLAEAAEALRRRLARERGRARCGHRSYDLNRHILLHRALRAVEARLDAKG